MRRRSLTALYRAADRTGPDLRRPGRDRDRERPAVRRGAGEHPRSHRGADQQTGEHQHAEGDRRPRRPMSSRFSRPSSRAPASSATPTTPSSSDGRRRPSLQRASRPDADEFWTNDGRSTANWTAGRAVTRQGTDTSTRRSIPPKATNFRKRRRRGRDGLAIALSWACRCCATMRASERSCFADRSASVQRQADRLAADLRRSGGDRDRQCAAVRARSRQRTRELSQSLDELRTAQDRLVQTEKLASLGQLTAGIAHEIKNPLNFVNNFCGAVGRTDRRTERRAEARRARRQDPRRKSTN